MFRISALLLVVCTGASVTFGVPTKIMTFEHYQGESPDADGMAILNYRAQQNNTTAQIILSNLVGSAEYVVVLREPGTWCLDTTTAAFAQAVFQAESPGVFFFPIDAENQFANPVGHLTFHGSTTSGSGDFSDADVLIFLQTDWSAAFPPDPNATELAIRVRLIGYNGSVSPNSCSP